MDEVKPHTRFVPGGIYARKLPGNGELVGTLIGYSMAHGNGKKVGVIYTNGHVPSEVIADGPTLDEWTLVSEACTDKMFHELEERYFARVEELEARIRELEAAGAKRPEPKLVDPLDELNITTTRAQPKREATARR